mmetsp:Transcript_18581/g.17666  ORF Transcript_18581/g.17666 Transcript_18581/m.17666 type:complete len:93 (+) Transcript_18581:655-933(+)
MTFSKDYSIKFTPMNAASQKKYFDVNKKMLIDNYNTFNNDSAYFEMFSSGNQNKVKVKFDLKDPISEQNSPKSQKDGTTAARPLQGIKLHRF